MRSPGSSFVGRALGAGFARAPEDAEADATGARTVAVPAGSTAAGVGSTGCGSMAARAAEAGKKRGAFSSPAGGGGAGAPKGGGAGWGEGGKCRGGAAL